MSWGMVAVGVGSMVVGAVGASKQAKAAKQAAQAGTDAANQANATELQIYNQARADNEPFRQNALTAQNEFMQLMGLQQQPQQAQQPSGMGYGMSPEQMYLRDNPDVAATRFRDNPMEHYDLYGRAEGRPWGSPKNTMTSATPQTPQQTPQQMQQSAFDRFRSAPGYQFGLKEGQNTIETGAAARGGLFSGATAKALQRFGNDYADQQGFTPYMNRLASLGQMGQTAAAQNQMAGDSYANSYGKNLGNAANARASGLMGSANAWANFGNEAISGLGRLYGVYQGSKG